MIQAYESRSWARAHALMHVSPALVRMCMSIVLLRHRAGRGAALPQGHCRYGEGCSYAHMVNVLPEAPVCPDFLRGYCAAGVKCTMKHFTQRSLTEYSQSAADYEYMLSAALKARCDPSHASISGCRPQCTPAEPDPSLPGARAASAEAHSSASVREEVCLEDLRAVAMELAGKLGLPAASARAHLGGIMLSPAEGPQDVAG
jgi:hypothetical protein